VSSAPAQLRTGREKKQHKNLLAQRNTDLHEIKLHLKMAPSQAQAGGTVGTKSGQPCDEKALLHVAEKGVPQ
jgi:hypothetical protein